MCYLLFGKLLMYGHFCVEPSFGHPDNTPPLSFLLVPVLEVVGKGQQGQFVKSRSTTQQEYPQKHKRQSAFI